jgi:DNA-binding response OmpR family regulator
MRDQVWGTRVSVTDRTVDTHISSLRKKMGDQARCVVLVPGSRYRFEKSG